MRGRINSQIDQTRRKLLKDAARTFFDENGYYLARGVYSPQQIDRLEAEFDRVVRQVE